MLCSILQKIAQAEFPASYDSFADFSSAVSALASQYYQGEDGPNVYLVTRGDRIQHYLGEDTWSGTWYRANQLDKLLDKANEEDDSKGVVIISADHSRYYGSYTITNVEMYS